MNLLFDWISNNMRAADRAGLWFGNGLSAVCEYHKFAEALRHAIHMITGNEEMSNHISWECLDLAEAAINAAWFFGNISSDTPEMLCGNQRLVHGQNRDIEEIGADMPTSLASLPVPRSGPKV